MKRYWDYSEKERSEMTAETVESLMSAELMEAGVVRVEQPALLPTECEEIQGQTFFQLKCGYDSSNVAWKTVEDAAIAAEKAVSLGSDYVAGVYFHYANASREVKIEPITVYCRADIANHRKSAEQIKANRDANEAAMNDFQECCKAVENVTEGVWKDWHRCGRLKSRYETILKTREEYASICDGDMEKGDVFLAKAFPQPDIEAALAWVGVADVDA